MVAIVSYLLIQVRKWQNTNSSWAMQGLGGNLGWNLPKYTYFYLKIGPA